MVRTSRCGRDNPGSNPGADRRLCEGTARYPCWSAPRRWEWGGCPVLSAKQSCTTGLRGTTTCACPPPQRAGQHRAASTELGSCSFCRTSFFLSPHRLVVRTSRCGRDNPGSNPGSDILRYLCQFTKRETKFKVDSPGFEPGTLRMRSGCDTTTPQARRRKQTKNC